MSEKSHFRFGVFSLVGICTLCPLLLFADAWEQGGFHDNDQGTDNAAIHGLNQTHDLGAVSPGVADQDWYRLCPGTRSSYEAVVDSFAGDLLGVSGPVLARVDAAAAILQQADHATTGDTNLSLRWEVGTVLPGCGTEYLRVNAAACGAACDAADQYRIRFYETTISVARFNNSGSQTTVLMVQNPAVYGVGGTIWFWSTAGVQLGTSTFGLAPRATLVLNTSGVAGVAGQSGSITISHTARYGDLNVKAVALEPATGFSFDSPGVHRPH